MRKRKNFKLLALLLCLAALVSALVITVFAQGTDKEDATVAINAAFSDKKVGTTVKLDNDGYIGIPVEITTYYDYATHGATSPTYNGTISIMYVVNTRVERIGAKTDVEIIESMLERGYIVSVFDYKNHAKAVSPGLDWSTQLLRKDMMSSKFYNDTSKVKSGSYKDSFVVPAGYDLSYGNVFWEADKHASDGSLEKIVENWNTDFKNWTNLQNKIVYWRNALGEQKSVENGAEWFSDAAGKNPVEATASNANYTKVKYTIANDVTDCVGPDGTPIDLNLYMNIVYPTTTKENPIDPVPIAVLANSSEYLNTASTGSGMRPQHNGFLFRGYAGANFDYLYQPMCQSDYWGYYDGRQDQGAVTNDRMNYGLHLYSDKKINTAAMRFLRYLTYTEGDTYAFDDESIGIFGNSKGGWFTFLGEAELTEYTVDNPSAYTKAELELLINNRINSYTSRRQFIGHNDESRFDNGITDDYTKNGVTIDGGELQPWLTYTDKDGNVKEILGYASWIYASNGSQYEDITEGHAPIFCALHMQDDFSTTTNLFSEVSRCLDIPSMYVIVDLGHTFAYGPDYLLGYDTYDAMFDFANYYLKGDAVKVVYTDPADKNGAMLTTAPITVKFSGAVPASEITKVTLSAGGNVIPGTWSAVRGNTEWTFTPAKSLLPATAYTLTVPADIAGDNGKAMGETFTATYYTESESVYNVTKTNASLGAYFTLTVPSNATASDAKIRFYVANNAANIADLYVVNNFDAANPAASTKGALVDSVNLNGIGYYEIDVTKYVLEANAGDKLTFLLQQKKTAEVKETYNLEFAGTIKDVAVQRYAKATATTAPDGTNAVEFKVLQRNNFTVERFYENNTSMFKNSVLFGSSAISPSDLGRQYKITLRIYDTVSRFMQVTLGKVEGAGVYDKDNSHYGFVTKANEWTEYSFNYTVYEPEYGLSGLAKKTLELKANSTGGDESPFYLGGIKVTETVDDIQLGAAELALGERGSDYKKDTAGNAFSIGSNTYATLKAAVTAATSGATIKLNKNYTLSGADEVNFGTLGSVTLDLNGYKLYATSSVPVINIPATTTAVANITVKNGDIYLASGPLMGYTGSTAAGKGKVINVNLENLGVYNAKDSTVNNFISASTIESASGAEVKVTMTGVKLNHKKAYNSKNPVTLLSNGSSSLSVNYVIKGGSINVDNIYAVKVYDTFKKVEAAKDSLGNYVTLCVADGISVPAMGIRSEGSMKLFSKSGVSNGIATYSLVSNSNATAFGIIPDGYEDTELYPFVMFDENGNFKGAYSYWMGNEGAGSVMSAARNYVVNAWNGTTYGDNPKEAYIVLRRNYTYTFKEDFDNIAQTQGSIHVELGGHTLSTSTYTSAAIIPAYSKGFSGAAGQKIFPTSIYFYNGKLMQGRSGIVGMSTWDSMGDGSIVNKDFNFIFNNVTFGFVQGSDTAGLIAHSWNPTTKTYAAPYNFTYNDCTFDIRTTQSKYAGVSIFNTKTTDMYAKATHIVNGGTIIADNPSKITIVQTVTGDNYGSSVTFGKGSDGNYLSFKTLTSAAAPTGSYKADNGDNLLFKANGTSGNDTIYTLDGSDLATDYGVITSTYADKQAYPFVVFNEKGGVIKGYATFSEALNGAKTYLQGNVWDPVNKTYGSSPLKATIVLRREYTTNATDAKYVNLAQAQGEILIDLGGYTITQGSDDNKGIFGEAKAKGWGDSKDEKIFPSTYTIINGGFKVTTNSLLTISTWETVGDGEIGKKDFTFNFKNVNIGYASGATAKNVLFSYGAAKAEPGCTLSKAAPFYMNFEDCDFDLKTNAPVAGSPYLFTAANTHWVKNTVTVKGGTIVSNSMTAARLFTTENVYGSTVTFLKGTDGKYTTLTVNNTLAAPTENIPGESGTVLKFAREVVNSNTSLYSLSTIFTKYGVIPENYANITNYPLAVFQNGWFVGAYNVFADGGNTTGALAKAKELLDGSVASEIGGQVEIFFREDAAATNTFPNVGQILGTVVIDLNGKTFTQNYSTKSLFRTEAKNWKGTDDAVFKVFNGNIVLQTCLLTFDGYGDTYKNGEGDKTFKMDFDNVNISYKSGANATELLGVFGERMTGGKKVYYDITFNNCVFDLTNAKSLKTVFNANDTDVTLTNSIVKVNVKGGNVIYANANPVLYGVNTSNGSSVTFSKNDAGSYTTLTLAAGAKNPAVNANNGALTTVKVSESATTTVYTFAPASASSFVPKMSITLGNEFVLNVYIPTNNTQKFTFDGVTYENLTNFDGETVTLEDEKTYYLVSVYLGSSEAAKEIKLSAEIMLGETLARANFTFSIPSYVTKVLADDEASSVEKTLAKDVLQYVREAYNYSGFSADNTASEIARVNALIKSIIGDYTGAPVSSGVTNTVAGVSGVTLNLDAKPTVRFYVTDTTLSFYANGVKLNTVSGTDKNGTYTELDVYAYVLAQTITYGNGGSYHVSSFITGSLGQTHEALVKAFVKYTESAAAYRNSVVNK